MSITARFPMKRSVDKMLKEKIGVRYDPSLVEFKWQKVWEEKKTFRVDIDNAKKPYYNLSMFPYPSAEGLHVGHIIPYSGSDTFGRYMRMKGFDVFEPMGFDAFGIHSENFAIKKGIHPAKLTAQTTKYFKDQQMKKLGTMFDWERMVDTSNPNYYKWTQWLFVQMFKAGLAIRKKALVNWCPSCKTVLSDEQVTKQSNSSNPSIPSDSSNPSEISLDACERCKTPVERREMEQWFFKITKYSQRLLDNLDKINWSKKTIIAQRNWIGRSEGINITYEVVSEKDDHVGEVTCFTTRPDTNFGATFVVLSPEHQLVNLILRHFETELVEGEKPSELCSRIKQYVEKAKNKSEQERITEGREKTGVFTGLYCVNQLNGSKMPLWISDFVVMSFGTGAVVGVPGHDKRDFEFAQKFNIPIINVVSLNGKMIGLIKRKWSKNFDEFINNLQKIKAEIVEQNKDEVLYIINNKDLDKWISFAGENVLENSWHDLLGDRYVVVLNDEVYKLDKFLDDKQGIFERQKKLESSVRGNKNIWEMLYKSRYANFIVQEKEGKMINSGFLDGMDIHKATIKIMDYLEEKGWGERETHYKLRDWCISRQRYWGPPIPMVYCKDCADKGISYWDIVRDNLTGNSILKTQNFEMSLRATRQLAEDEVEPQRNPAFGGTICSNTFKEMKGWFPVNEEDLPVLLPETNDYLPDGSGKSPLAKISSFVKTKCPNCGSEAERETDVSDTFLDSAWYFLRYPSVNCHSGQAQREPESSSSCHSGLDPESIQIDPDFPFDKLRVNCQDDKFKIPFDPQITKKWLPVDMYIGGNEHACLHLMYSRFVTMALHDMGFINFDEPFERFFAHGLMIKDGAKMSKSKGNVVNPDTYLKKYGADALRMYVLFLGPYDAGGDFRDSGIEGMTRFLNRVYRFGMQIIKSENLSNPSIPPVPSYPSDLLRSLHKLIRGVGEDLENLKFNTAIAKLMEFLNEATTVNNSVILGSPAQPDDSRIKNTKLATRNSQLVIVNNYLILLAPLAPHLSEELYQELRKVNGGTGFGSVHSQKWPEYDPKILIEDLITIVVQFNGKTRGTLIISADILNKDNAKEEIIKMVKENEKWQRYFLNKKIQKTIYVSLKLINFVI